MSDNEDPTPRLLARFEVVGEDDDKALRGWTEGDKQESTHDELTVYPDAWPLGTVVEVRAPGDALQREPFVGFDDVGDEQRELAQKLADHFADAFVRAGMQAPTSDHAILATHIQHFAEHAMRESPTKSSKLVRALFDDSTDVGRAIGLMFAALVQRLYSAPYGSLNEAALDFANVLVPALEVAAGTTKKKLKHPGG